MPGLPLTPIRAPSLDAPEFPVAGLPMNVSVGVPPPSPSGPGPKYTQRFPGLALGFVTVPGHSSDDPLLRKWTLPPERLSLIGIVNEISERTISIGSVVCFTVDQAPLLVAVTGPATPVAPVAPVTPWAP